MAKEKIRTKPVPEKKLKLVEEFAKLMRESNSILFASIKNLPSSQYNSIKKKLRETAEMRLAKKNIMLKAIDLVEKGTIKNLKKYIKEDMIILFSALDAFELSAILSKNKSMSKAKVGQKIEVDIEVDAGPTELVPGPVISELSGLGIKFAIEEGKISIREKKTILKAGETVTEAAASIMAKFDMKPVALGLEPFVAYNAKEEVIYEDIKIDEKKTLEELKESKARALAFAVKLAYACKDTIGFLLAKALSHEKALSKFIKPEEVK